MIDFHTHILPRMDDGSSSPAESVEMILCAAGQGVHALALTPHFYPEQEALDDFFLRRGAAANRLKAAMWEQGVQAQLHLGAEINYFHGISRMDMLENMCIGKTRGLLLNLPLCPWTSRMLTELKTIRNVWGLQPIIAHVGRHLVHQKGYVLRDLCASGVMLQADSSFFIDKNSSAMAMHMLKRQMIHVIGSDCHDMQTRRPDMGLALQMIREKLGDGAIAYLRDMQNQILGV